MQVASIAMRKELRFEPLSRSIIHVNECISKFRPAPSLDRKPAPDGRTCSTTAGRLRPR